MGIEAWLKGTSYILASTPKARLSVPYGAHILYESAGRLLIRLNTVVGGGLPMIRSTSDPATATLRFQPAAAR
jgi:hypothetical protein